MGGVLVCQLRVCQLRLSLRPPENAPASRRLRPARLAARRARPISKA